MPREHWLGQNIHGCISRLRHSKAHPVHSLCSRGAHSIRYDSQPDYSDALASRGLTYSTACKTIKSGALKLQSSHQNTTARCSHLRSQGEEEPKSGPRDDEYSGHAVDVVLPFQRHCDDCFTKNLNSVAKDEGCYEKPPAPPAQRSDEVGEEDPHTSQCTAISCLCACTLALVAPRAHPPKLHKSYGEARCSTRKILHMQLFLIAMRRH